MMTKFLSVFIKTIFLAVAIAGCSGNSNSSTAPVEDKGILKLVVNGEDFVRNGFVTKDDWQIDFERVAVNAIVGLGHVGEGHRKAEYKQ